MQWTVRGENSSVTIEAEMLIQDFLARKEVSDEHKFVASALVDLLSRGKVLSKYSIEELASLAFFNGYYYRMFIEQNDVEVKHVDSSENRGIESPKQS